MGSTRTFTLVATHEPDAERDFNWTGYVKGVYNSHVRADSLGELRRRMQDHLARKNIPGHDDARFEVITRLSPASRSALAAANTARSRAAGAASVARFATLAAAQQLSNVDGISRRDVAELMGLSFQRVQQLLSASSLRDVDGLLG